MKIKLQGETVELSEKAENSLIEFMQEVIRLMPYEEYNMGRAYIFTMDDTEAGFDVEFSFTSDVFPPHDDLGQFGVIFAPDF